MARLLSETLPADVDVVVEVPRGAFVKRRTDGAIDFVSPLPCPFNYGSIPSLPGEDGDPVDAVVIGRRLARGTSLRLPVRAVMGFVDDGCDDPKVVVAERPLRAIDRAAVAAFFRVYAPLKRALNAARGRRGATRCVGWL